MPGKPFGRKCDTIFYALYDSGMVAQGGFIQEVFHVYLNKFEMAVSHLFLIIICNDIFT